LKHPSLPKVVDFCSGFLGSIPDIPELSTLLVLRGATPGIHGGELLRREMMRKEKDGGNARPGCITIRMSKSPKAVRAQPLAFSRRERARVVLDLVPSLDKEGAGNAGCATHPQPRVQW
jgi:hypothetical protein